MDAFLRDLIPFLAILNPFALSLYLAGVMEELTARQFLHVLLGACGISIVVFSLCALAGETMLVDWLGVRPSALRVFGGMIFFVVGYNYVLRGYRATEMLRGSAQALPSAIALPFMIGAGTITQSILIGKQHASPVVIALLAVGVGVSFGFVMAFKWLRDRMRGPREQVFDRYINILARLNGLVIGAVSTDMVVTGLHELWRAT